MSEGERLAKIVLGYKDHPLLKSLRDGYDLAKLDHDPKVAERMRLLDEISVRDTGRTNGDGIVYAGGNVGVAAYGLAVSIAEILIDEISQAIMTSSAG